MAHPSLATASPKQTGEGLHMSMDARIHALTLRFPPALDERFADEHFAQMLVQVRLGLALAVSLHAWTCTPSAS